MDSETSKLGYKFGQWRVLIERSDNRWYKGYVLPDFMQQVKPVGAVGIFDCGIPVYTGYPTSQVPRKR